MDWVRGIIVNFVRCDNGITVIKENVHILIYFKKP